MTDLLALGAEVRGTDAEAATAARTHARPALGRLAELGEWLAATTGSYPPARALRVRMAVIGNPVGIVLGILFVAAGAGRLYVARKTS